MEEKTKKCPFCAEEININAIKCKHCGEFMEEETSKEENTSTTKQCPFCKEEILKDAIKCKHCGEWLNKAKQIPTQTQAYQQYKKSETVESIAQHQQISNIIWLIIALIQILTLIGIIAGIWNLIATVTNWGLPEKIKAHDKNIPSYYEGIVGLIVIAIINVIFGGIIGVILVGYDFYIRSLVLNNRELFNK